MTINIARGDQRVTEFEPLKFCTEASSLELAPDAPLPRTIETDMGNKEPFVFHHLQTDGAGELLAIVYQQRFGCLRLHILND
jgi:hypothetical protein